MPGGQGAMVPREQWLELHKVCLDTVRSAIRGLSGEGLAAKPLPNDDSIGEQANHVVGAESYWRRKVHMVLGTLCSIPAACICANRRNPWAAESVFGYRVRSWARKELLSRGFARPRCRYLVAAGGGQCLVPDAAGTARRRSW